MGMIENVFGVTPTAVPDPDEVPQPAVIIQEAPASDPAPVPEPVAASPAEQSAVVAEPEEEAEKEFLSENPEEGFKIGNKTYKSLEAADHVFRQFGGRARAEAERRKSAEADAQEARAERDRLATALRLLEHDRAQQPQTRDDKGTPAPAASPAKPKRLADRVTDEEFDQLVAEHGPAKAFRRALEVADERMDEVLDEATREVKPYLQRTQMAERTGQIFDEVAALKGSDGKLVYPELADANSPIAAAVFEVWQKNLSNPRLAPIALSEDGIRYAVLEYRSSGGQPASSGPRSSAGAAVQARKSADASLQGIGSGGKAGVRLGPVGNANDSDEAIQVALRAGRHPVFGVTVAR